MPIHSYPTSTKAKKKKPAKKKDKQILTGQAGKAESAIRKRHKMLQEI